MLVLRVDDGGLHGGQLGLPGGKPEPADDDLLATALREAQEEVGLEPGTVTSWRASTRSRRRRPAGSSTRSSGASRAGRSGSHRSERSSASSLLPSGARRAERAPYAAVRLAALSEPLLVEGIDVEGHVLWGMTLRLLDNVVPRLLAGEWAV